MLATKMMATPCQQFSVGAVSMRSKPPVMAARNTTAISMKTSSHLCVPHAAPLSIRAKATGASLECGNLRKVAPITPFHRTDWEPTSHSLRGLLSQQSSKCAVEHDSSYRSGLEFDNFMEAFKTGNIVPVWQKLDMQLGSPQARSCLAARTDRRSEILIKTEHVNNAGDFTILGAPPSIEVKAEGVLVTLLEYKGGIGPLRTSVTSDDPMVEVLRVSGTWQSAMLKGLPNTFCGGWIDLINHRLPESRSDSLQLNEPEIHIGLVDEVVVINRQASLVYAVHWVHMNEFATPELAYESAALQMKDLVAQLRVATGSTPSPPRIPRESLQGMELQGTLHQPRLV